MGAAGGKGKGTGGLPSPPSPLPSLAPPICLTKWRRRTDAVT